MSDKICSVLVCLIVALLTVFMVSSCGDKGPTSVNGDSDKGSIAGQVVTSDAQAGIDDALVLLSAENFTTQETYTEDGKFQFSNLNHGEYNLSVKLPQGYSENDELERQITVDGDRNIQIRANPVREKTATIQKGTIDTLATSSGVYLTIDATESDVDVELYIEEIDDAAFSDKQILSKPIQIRFGSNSGASTSGKSSSLQGNISSSAGTGSRVTMNLSKSYTGNSDEAMFTFQLDDDEPIFAYAEGLSEDFTDANTFKQTQVINYEISLPPEIEFQFSVALTRRHLTCGDINYERGYRSLKEHEDVLDGDKPLILIHGIQLRKATCDEFINYEPEAELFEPLIQELRGNDAIKNNYRLYTYRYPSNAPVLENSIALWDMMQLEGIEEPVIIAHSMGGLVARGMMLAEGEDKVTGLITFGTPHEGSPIADLAVTRSINDIIKCADIREYPLCFARDLGLVFTPITKGFLDLRENSDLISDLISLEGSSDKVFTIAGTLPPYPAINWEALKGRTSKENRLAQIVYYLGYRYMSSNSQDNDGMVPLESATPSWTTILDELKDHNHSEVIRGWNNNAVSVFETIRPVLLQLVSALTEPQLVSKDVTDITSTSAVSGGQISNDGGADITERGVCWSTSQDPDLNDSCTSDGSGTGEFTSSLTGLSSDTEYFVRAYATNELGTGYGDEKSFTTDSEPDNIGRDTTTEIVDVYNPATGRTWMDRNLGASRAATSPTDEQAYGDLYQWGRAADGHQKRNSGTTSMISSTPQPEHGDFITVSSRRNWHFPHWNNLWQGTRGINNPCPEGYRLPTKDELDEERQSWRSNDADGAFASPLKLPSPGYRDLGYGTLVSVGTRGTYWSSTIQLYFTRSRVLVFSSNNSNNAGLGTWDRSWGVSVRCIKD